MASESVVKLPFATAATSLDNCKSNVRIKSLSIVEQNAMQDKSKDVESEDDGFQEVSKG